MTTMSTPIRTGYADVDGLHLYYEEYGSAGTPLVLLHGGMLTIDLNFAELIPRLAARHRVIAVEQQGHGRTGDIDRVISPANSASDVVALLDHLGIPRAHVLGHSMGGAVAMELAVSHPDRVLSVVPISITVRPEGMHADFGDPEAMATSTRMPTAEDMAAMREAYTRLSPHPEHFDEFLGTLSASEEDLRGWTDEQLAGVTAPVLFVIGDHDFTTIEHAGFMVQKTPGSQLLVLPGTTHMLATHRVEILDPVLGAFLD
ncbi:oxidoreductase [Actinocatenispora thailandica]|uniref:Oxidoreductase n=1 Tax=Actinocatenispora thailandica TaxID=227318 RepID=A0A7R7DTK8_9ACTN|nr:alpha/beta hydrolase [Actinocatenispora thailandica]BCJ37430.1 oxidoreductase [Actinocatenispora thailandica]